MNQGNLQSSAGGQKRKRCCSEKKHCIVMDGVDYIKATAFSAILWMLK